MKRFLSAIIITSLLWSPLNAINQVGGGGGNATSITGVDIDPTSTAAPSDDDILQYKSGSGNWEAVTLTGGGDMLKSTYDTDTDSKVDDSERVDGVTHNYTSPADNTLINYDSASASYIDVTIDDALTGVGNIEASGTVTASAVVATNLTGTLQTAAQTNITSVGTIGTGTWQGTAVADAYVSNDLTLAGGAIGTSALTLVQSAGPTPTTEGVIEWDTDDNRIAIGDGAGTKTFQDDTANDAEFAPIAKGVTNGDTHDHSGGDGAQINHTTLSNIGTNTHAQIDTHIASTANPHTVTKSDLSLGNVEDTALSTWAGSASLTTLGTIGTGVWNGTAIVDAYVADDLTIDSSNSVTANVLSDGTISITGGNLTGATGVTATNLTGTLQTASQTNITAVGTIATGTWQGTAVADTYVAEDLTITGGTIDATSTLTNTLISGQLDFAGQNQTPSTKNITIDGANGNSFSVDLESVGAAIDITLSNMVTDNVYAIEFIQGATARQITSITPDVKWPSAVTPSITTTENSTTVITIVKWPSGNLSGNDGGGTYYE